MIMKKILFLIFLFLSLGAVSQLQVGDQAPDFIGTDNYGVQHQLSDHLSQGKYVLLKFGWITCAPCHDATFGTNIIYHAFGCNNDDIVVLGIDPQYNAVDYTTYWDTWDPLTANQQGQIPASHWLSTPKYPKICKDDGGEAISNLYNLQAAPTYYLIAPDGTIVAGGENNGTIFDGLQTVLANWFGVYAYLEGLGINPVIPLISAEQYYIDNVEPNIATDNFTSTPYSELCNGPFTGNGPCDQEVATNVQVQVDQNSNEAMVSWTGGSICTSWYVSIYSETGTIGTWMFEQTVTGNTATFSNIPPGTYSVGIYCTCNDSYTSSDPVQFTIDYDQIITDFTHDNCSDTCVYTLTLNTNDFAGGASDWLANGFYVEIIVNNTISGGFWLTSSELTNSWDITACTHDPIKIIAHASTSGGFAIGAEPSFILTTPSNDTVVNCSSFDSYFDELDPNKTEHIAFLGSVNCNIDCSPSPIPLSDFTYINNPANVNIVDWSDDNGCGSYTVAYQLASNASSGLWQETVVTESQWVVPFSVSSFPDDINMKVRCNCVDGGQGPFSEVYTFTITPYYCTPLQPTNLQTTAVTSTSVSIEWTPANNTPCQLYHVMIKKDSDTDWMGYYTQYTNYLFTNLESNTNYEIKVACVCNMTDSPFSEPIAFTTPNPNDCSSILIQNITGASSSTTSAVITWDMNTECESYTVRYISDNESLWHIETSLSSPLQITGLTPNEIYTVQVRCDCGVANGGYDLNATFNTIVGIAEFDGNSIMIYPNPASNQIVIESESSQNARIIIESIDGKIVLEKEFKNTIEIIDINMLGNGTYFISLLENDREIKRSKLIINK